MSENQLSTVHTIYAGRHQRLRKVFIVQEDAFEILGKITDVEGMAIYVDPPYLLSTRAGGCRYLHEFTEEDHERLATVLLRFREARVVLSYYDDPRLAGMYPGWTKRNCYRQKNLHVQNRRGVGNCTAPEVLLLNGPSYEKTKEDEDASLPLFNSIKN